MSWELKRDRAPGGLSAKYEPEGAEAAGRGLSNPVAPGDRVSRQGFAADVRSYRSAVAVDLGGTSIRTSVVDADGSVRDISRVATPSRGRDAVLTAICSEVQSTAEAGGGLAEMCGVGLGSPGMVDDNGYLHGPAVNIVGWRDFDIASELRSRLGVPVIVLNDANAAAMGEFYYGAGSGMRAIALVTVGTGVGVGLVIGGRPYAGNAGVAGELGHLVVRPGGRICACGNRGCVEAYASSVAIGRIAGEEAERYTDCSSGLARLVRTMSGSEMVEADVVYDYLSRGDGLAGRVHKQVCLALGQTAAILASTLAPERIVFAGGLMGSADVILPAVRKEFESLVLPHVSESITLTQGRLGPVAGLVGAAAAVMVSVH